MNPCVALFHSRIEAQRAQAVLRERHVGCVLVCPPPKLADTAQYGVRFAAADREAAKLIFDAAGIVPRAICNWES